jgi:Tfp pilus assembly protein PilO
MQFNKPVSIIIMFLVTLLVAFLFVIPTYQQSLNLRTVLGQKQAEFSGKSLYYATIADLTGKIENNSVALDKINSALPDDFYLSTLVYFLQKKADDAGLITKLIVFSKVPPKV